MAKYKHLTLSERIEIYTMLKEGKSLRKIGKALNRDPTTIAKEMLKYRASRSACSVLLCDLKCHAAALFDCLTKGIKKYCPGSYIGTIRPRKDLFLLKIQCFNQFEYTHPLSGFLFCADCGGKMKLEYYTLKHNGKAVDIVYTFNCGNHKRLGKAYCSSHYIKAKDIEKFILDDVKAMASCITLNEDEVRKKYLERKTKLAEDELMHNRNELDQKSRRCDKLDQLIETAFEEKIAGNMSEDLCVKLIERYSSERQQLLDEIDAIDKQEVMIANVQNDVDDFIARVKRHMSDVTLTRALCFELIDKIVIGKTVSGKVQNIEIYYKVDLNFAR